MKILFVEPPKDFWFIMGQYIPPPFGILALGGYIEREVPDVEIEVVDSQSEGLDWKGLEKRIEKSEPDIVAPSGMSTANAYLALRTAQLVKSIDTNILTVLGGQHFTSLAEDTLRSYPEVDYIVRGEGELTLSELIFKTQEGLNQTNTQGLTYRVNEQVKSNPERDLIVDLNNLPYPAYHLVGKHMKKYYFSLMAEKETPFAIVEGSRGCSHNCSYCSQSPFWRHAQRMKTPKRIVDEMEYLNKSYGSGFLWLTDDYFRIGSHSDAVCNEIEERGLKMSWFCQVRCDDIVQNKSSLTKLSNAGCVWMLIGFDTPHPSVLSNFRRIGVTRDVAKQAIDLLREHGILSQGTFIIGERGDDRESIRALREYADWLDPDLATFMALTPFPGTEIFEEAMEKGWIEDYNWAHYDMIHSIMPTEKLSRAEVQEELHACYNAFFGNWARRFRGINSKNAYLCRTYQYLAKQALMTGLRQLF